MKRTKEHKIEWSGKIKEKEISDILFDELIIRKANIKGVVFKNVHFKNSQLGFDAKYYECDFIDCKFYGKYSSLGKPSTYNDCRFENCEFVGIDLFTGQHFKNCVLSGLMKNPILHDKHPQIENSETVFNNCDMTDLIFDNVSIYGKDVFRDCVLPKQGIRLFDNTGDKLIERAEQICRNINSSDKIASEIIFRRDLKKGQNPIILDDMFLESFFETENSRKTFDEITKGYELNE